MQVKKKECCCTAGKAWGTRCELCPSRGTGKEHCNLILFCTYFCFPLQIYYAKEIKILVKLCLLRHFFHLFLLTVEYSQLCQTLAQVKIKMKSKYSFFTVDQIKYCCLQRVLSDFFQVSVVWTVQMNYPCKLMDCVRPLRCAVNFLKLWCSPK